MPVIDRVTPEQALERVSSALGDSISASGVSHGQIDVTCAPARVVDVVSTLRTADGLQCEYFTFLSAVDRTEFGGEDVTKHGGLEVLIHLYSPNHVIHVNVHVPVDLENPVCPTITNVFGGALWHERETHEMFGIDFEGHPKLVNLYLPEDFAGTPMRRSFKLPSRNIKDWPGAKDPEEAAAGGR
ncbi:MAG: NADH-quinone oxidoreductase subunit [Actinomycetota bacterium]|jgi:NADH-quinone oxidoreductase subunit C|nr:NADH-quinone oxidoreductase subunit [Actinomycetota bacterium]